MNKGKPGRKSSEREAGEFHEGTPCLTEREAGEICSERPVFDDCSRSSSEKIEREAVEFREETPCLTEVGAEAPMKGVGVTEGNSRPFGYFWGNAKSNRRNRATFFYAKRKRVE